MLDNTSATVFNRAVNFDTDETVFYRTVIPTVHWEDGFRTSSGKTGHATSHTDNRPAFVSIAFSNCSNMEKQYLPAHQFATLPSSEQSKYWTLAIGDILLKGTVAADIPNRGFKQWMAEHPEAASIASVETFDMGNECMRHWEVNTQ